MGVARQMSGWAAMKAARRLSRTFPIIGAVVAVATVGQIIRRKGWARGLASATLDALPFVGTAKAGVELFRGEIFPDRVPPAPAAPQPRRAAS